MPPLSLQTIPANPIPRYIASIPIPLSLSLASFDFSTHPLERERERGGQLAVATLTRSFSRNDRTSIRRVTFDGGERKDGSFRFAGRKTNSRRPTLSPTPWRINGGGGKPPPRFLHPRSSRLLISLSSIELFSKGEGGRRVQNGDKT